MKVSEKISANSLILHFLEFLILGILVLLSAITFQAGLIVSLLAEIIQGFLPYRAFSMIDIFFNLGGFLVGFFLLYSIKKYLISIMK